VRVFTTKTFARRARNERLIDEALVTAVDEMGRGLFDANLGGSVFKKRIALPGRGKQGSVRALFAYKEK